MSDKPKPKRKSNKNIDPDGWHKKVEPYTGDDPPRYDLEDWEITQEDKDRAFARWDEVLPKHKGLLDAEVIKKDKPTKKDNQED